MIGRKTNGISSSLRAYLSEDLLAEYYSPIRDPVAISPDTAQLLHEQGINDLIGFASQ